MKKSKIIVPAVALLTLGLAASVTGTVAWYTANSNATVNANAATGNLTSTTSTINAGEYSINFTVTPTASQLQLSHVVEAAEASAGLNGVTSPAAGDLIYGVISNGTATMRKCGGATGFISAYSISASWVSTPTDPADVAYLGGKSFTINLTVGGNAKFLSSNNVTGLTNQTTATAVVHIAASTLALTVDTLSQEYVHIEPASLSAAESGTAGSISVTAASGVTLA